MKFWIAILAYFVLPIALRGQTVPSKPATNCTVRGQMVQQPGGNPIRKVNIRLFGVGKHGESEEVEYSAVTDAEGRFEFDSVKPGPYRIAYDRAGFVDAEKRHHGDGSLLLLERGQEIKGLLFHMAPAAVITGKVLDSDGDPVPKVEVTAVPYPRNTRAIGALAGAITDDLGEFRIGELPAKRYLLVAQPILEVVRAVQSSRKVADAAQSYGTVYYPNTTEPSQAIPLSLGAGDEVRANISLAPIRSFQVRGEVTSLSPRRGDASVMLRPLDDLFMAVIEPWPIDKDGHFEIRGVSPGSYAILLILSDTGASRTFRADQTIQVTNADIDGLRVAPLPNGDIRGEIRTDTGKRIDWSQLEVNLYSNQRRAEGASTSSGDIYKYLSRDERDPDSNVKSNGTFEMKDVPAGTYRVQVVATGDALADYFVKAINLDGRDIRTQASPQLVPVRH